MALDPHPLPNDPGFRYLLQQGDASRAGTCAVDVLGAAGQPLHLDAGMALSLLAYAEYHAYRPFLTGLALVPMRCPLEQAADGSLSFSDGRAPPSHTPADAPKDVRRLVDEAVEVALTPWNRAAVWLSGGTDSSAVAAAAAAAWRRLDRNPTELRFYHQRPATGPNEAQAAMVVARALGHALCIHADAGIDPFADTAPYLARLDFPIDGSGCGPMLAFAQRLQHDGIEGYLTGDGGDECFGPRHPSRGVRGLVKRTLPGPLLRSLRQRRSDSALPAWLRARQSEFPAAQHAPRERVGLDGIAADRDRAIRCARQSAIVGGHRALADMFGQQVAFPLLDAAVMDYAVAIPQHLHGRADQPKRLLKLAYADLLPRAALERTKVEQPYYEPNHLAALSTWGDSWWERWIRGGRLASAGLLSEADNEAMRTAAGTGTTADIYRALAVVGLEIWMQELDIEVQTTP